MANEAVHFDYWRIGVIGSSHQLPIQGAEMCEAIGARLAQEPTVLIVHGGLKRRSQADALSLAADWYYVEGARSVLRKDAGLRLETVLPEPDLTSDTVNATRPSKEERDDASAEMFIEGNLRRIRGRTREARRFGFVNSLDAVIAVGGGHGTRQQLTLAAAIDKPMLPVPCLGGAAAKFWEAHFRDLQSQLQISDLTAREWECPPSSRDDIVHRADAMVNALLARLPKRVFVVMPYATEHDTLYDLVVEPAVSVWRDEIRRLDRKQTPGSVVKQIEDGIRTADYCIVVLDGLRPNVLYEMGYAQALGKPLILIMQQDALNKETVPFDISTLQRIEYQRPDSTTLNRLREAIGRVVRRAGR